MPGTIRVQLHNAAEAGPLGTDLQLALTHRFDHLRVAYYRPAAGRDLLATLEALRAHARLQSADLELLEFIAAPN